MLAAIAVTAVTATPHLARLCAPPHVPIPGAPIELLLPLGGGCNRIVKTAQKPQGATHHPDDTTPPPIQGSTAASSERLGPYRDLTWLERSDHALLPAGPTARTWNRYLPAGSDIRSFFASRSS